MTTNTIPVRASMPAAASGDSPDVRITVYSDVAASEESATSVPISTTSGKSSYAWPGTSSSTKPMACWMW